MKLRWREAGHFANRPNSAISVVKGRTRVWRWLEYWDGNKWVEVKVARGQEAG